MTLTQDVPRDPPHGLAAMWLWRVSGTTIALMPLGMALANRSSVAFLLFAAFCSLIAAILDRQLPSVWRDARTALSTPLGIAALSFAAWTVLSLAWSGAPEVTLHFLGEFWLPVGSACFMSLVMPQRMLRIGLSILLVSLLIACAIILVELLTNGAGRQVIGARTHSFIFNRSAVTVLLISLPLLWWLLSARETGARTQGIVLVAAVAALVFMSESGAATLGALIGIAVYSIARVFGRSIVPLGVAAGLTILASAPVLGDLSDRLIPGSFHAALASAHSSERVEIWKSFGAVVREQPWLGTGFATSARMPHLPAAQKVDPEQRPHLALSHPHNAALQIWVELGAVGAFLAGIVVFLALRSIGGLPPRRMAPAAMLFAVVAGISIVSHGAWQGWWAAVVGTAIVWLQCTYHLGRETSP